jgi:chromosome partitioning protein
VFVSFINQKGGTGKTSLALHVAALMPGFGFNTLLIDADPQASAMAWHACRVQSGRTNPPGLTVMANSNGTITDQLPELARSYDCVVIDGPPRGDRIARDVILASDLVMVPTRLSGFDVWAADSISKTIEEMRGIQRMASKRPLDWFYVINQKNARTTAGRAILRSLEKSGARVLDAHVCERACFVEATSLGLTIHETESAKAKGCVEIERLAEEIRGLIAQRQQARSAA